MSRTVQFSTADYTGRIASVACVSNVKSSGGGLQIQVYDGHTSGVLQSVLAVPVEVRAQRYSRPDRHTLEQQMRTIAALQVLSGGDVEVHFDSQAETPRFSSIEITVKTELERQLAGELIADEIDGAPVTFRVNAR